MTSPWGGCYYSTHLQMRKPRFRKVRESWTKQTTSQGWGLALTWVCASVEATQFINHYTWGTDHCLPGEFSRKPCCWLQASLSTAVLPWVPADICFTCSHRSEPRPPLDWSCCALPTPCKLRRDQRACDSGRPFPSPCSETFLRCPLEPSVPPGCWFPKPQSL